MKSTSGQRVELPVGHRGGHLRKLRAEETAEATAFLIGLPLDHLGATAGEQREWLLSHIELAQSMTTVMIGDATTLGGQCPSVSTCSTCRRNCDSSYVRPRK